MKVHVSKVLKFMMIFERDKPYDSSNVDVLQTVKIPHVEMEIRRGVMNPKAKRTSL